MPIALRIPGSSRGFERKRLITADSFRMLSHVHGGIENSFVTKPQRQLRLVQFACILLLVGCIVVAYIHEPQPRTNLGFGQGVVILLALWSAVGGFTTQRRLQRRNRTRSSKSTPFDRWKAGHIVRLWSAMTVGAWGLFLYEIRGPLWIADVLFALAMLLLLIWDPDAAPVADEGVPAQSSQ